MGNGKRKTGPAMAREWQEKRRQSMEQLTSSCWTRESAEIRQLPHFHLPIQAGLIHSLARQKAPKLQKAVRGRAKEGPQKQQPVREGLKLQSQATPFLRLGSDEKSVMLDGRWLDSGWTLWGAATAALENGKPDDWVTGDWRESGPLPVVPACRYGHHGERLRTVFTRKPLEQRFSVAGDCLGCYPSQLKCQPVEIVRSRNRISKSHPKTVSRRSHGRGTPTQKYRHVGPFA